MAEQGVDPTGTAQSIADDMRVLKTIGVLALAIGVVGLLAGGAAVWLLHGYSRDLPDYAQLADYRPPMVSRVHAGDGRLLAEFATEKRVFVPVSAMPRRVIDAFVSAEDKTFFEHSGIDLPGIATAAVRNLMRIGTDRRPVGASTITQQVTKNFLLSDAVSYRRKIREIILAFRIERALSKGRILELYLNQIYLGSGSYGVAAAAINYFNKSLDELTLAEAAFLAGLPKAPNNYNPKRRPEAARARRDYVIRRMLEDGRIGEAEAAEARSGPVALRNPDEVLIAKAEYFVEEVRRELAARFGETKLYGGGLSVRTTLDPRLQVQADRALRSGLIAYDRRHGWRGPIARVDPDRPIGSQLERIPVTGMPAAWRLAAVEAVTGSVAGIRLASGETGTIPLEGLRWARKRLDDRKRGPAVERVSDVLAPGDVVAVERETGPEGTPDESFALRQVPDIDGALVALDPHTGRVLALTGGFSFQASEFNRATQARRQPGSAFKPFVYLAALDSGLTPSSLVLDAPFVIDQGPGFGKWKPANYTRRFYGPSPMRIGIEKSRNLMTVRVAQRVGMEAVAGYAERFGVVERLPRLLSMALGAGETTLLRLTTAYAMLVNGGRKIVPTFLDRIQDRNGKTVFRHDGRACPGCVGVSWTGQEEPEVPDTREQVADPGSAYQIVSMLEGAVERGTGRRVRAVGKPLAGKTGTTNDSLDTWFIGFSPDLAVGVFVGFDSPRTLGRGETGSSVAAPIFRDFMKAALKGKPAIPFRIPPGIRLVRVDAETGLVARGAGKGIILEAFKPGTEPVQAGPVVGERPVTGAENPATPARRRDLY